MIKIPRMSSVRTLVRMAEAGAEGRFWYAFAESQVREAAEALAVKPERLADLLSLFSPRVGVTKSIRLTVYYIRRSEFRYDTLPSVRAAVRHYESTGEIRGTKTAPFARALLGDGSAVVLDSWMALAFGLDPKRQRFEYGYIRRAAESRIRKAARILGWTPAETQAAIWDYALRTLAIRGGEAVNRTPPAFELMPHIDDIPF